MPEKMLTLQELAEYLQVSEEKIISLVDEGVIIAYKIAGELLRFRRDQIEAIRTEIESRVSEADRSAFSAAQKKEKEKRFKDLLGLIKEKLDNVKEVRLSGRLTESACCLVADEHDMGAHMERLMKNMNQEVPSSKRILELNPGHPLVEAMHKLFEKDSKSPKLVEYSELLYEQALLAEGSKIKDPLLFARRINEFITKECETIAGS